MIFFELILGLVIVGLLEVIALFFAKRKSAKADIPRNKANMDQPQEEFIEPEGAHATADEAKK